MSEDSFRFLRVCEYLVSNYKPVNVNDARVAPGNIFKSIYLASLGNQSGIFDGFVARKDGNALTGTFSDPRSMPIDLSLGCSFFAKYEGRSIEDVGG